MTLNEQHVWDNILKNYFKEHGFVKHQIDSFDDCIQNGIQKVISE